MAGAPDTGLEGRLAQVEAALRSLMATNWTDRASVVDASGNAVPLSALAFGQVTATTPSYVSVQGSVGSFGNITSPDHTPQVVAYCAGGRLRVDFSGQLTASTAPNGDTAGYTSIAMTPWCRGPYPDAAAAAAGAVSAAVTTRATSQPLQLEVDHNLPTTISTGATAAGSFTLFTNLAPGFYLVAVDYVLDYDSTGSTGASPPGGSVRRRNLAVSPF